MKCPSCQSALPEDAAFCGQCGGALRSERKCERCGRSNSPEMRFCLGCGAALSPASPAKAPRTYTPKHLAEKIPTSRSAIEGGAQAGGDAPALGRLIGQGRTGVAAVGKAQEFRPVFTGATYRSEPDGGGVVRCHPPR